MARVSSTFRYKHANRKKEYLQKEDNQVLKGFSPTAAQLDSLKNNFKFAIKLT
jgi:hypothetical protein